MTEATPTLQLYTCLSFDNLFPLRGDEVEHAVRRPWQEAPLDQQRQEAHVWEQRRHIRHLCGWLVMQFFEKMS